MERYSMGYLFLDTALCECFDFPLFIEFWQKQDDTSGNKHLHPPPLTLTHSSYLCSSLINAFTCSSTQSNRLGRCGFQPNLLIRSAFEFDWLARPNQANDSPNVLSTSSSGKLVTSADFTMPFLSKTSPILSASCRHECRPFSAK